MSQSENRRESRFFTGGQGELSQIKSKERLQRFVRHNKTKKQISRFVYIAVFVAAIILFLLICLSVFFRIRTIEVVGSVRYSADSVISACGITTDMSLYEVTNRDVEILPKKLSYIRRASIKRKLPSTLVISLTEDTPVYFAELYGEYFVLSDELRVLEQVFNRDALSDKGLIELVLPPINTAITGSKIEFEADTTERYVTAYLDALQSSDLLPKVTAFDLRDRFNTDLICEEIYLVYLGNGDELGTKLTAVAGMLENEIFSDKVPATIDASDPSECPVIKDKEAVIAFDR